jgi:hypothetical protein
MAPTVRDPRDDDELDELPPMDGDPAPAAEADVGALLEEEAEDASLDDKTGEDEVDDGEDLEVDEAEGGWLDEAADAPDLDLGDVAITEFGGDVPADEVDEPGVGGEDFGLVEGEERGDLDAGDEGPVAQDEELREQDLPDLDADDEGDPQDASFVEAGFAADEPAGLPWSAEPWERVGAPVALASATALACSGRGALVAGRAEGGDWELARVDLEGASQAVAAAGLDVSQVRALQVDGSTIVALLEGGAAVVSSDAGARFEPSADPVDTPDATLVRLLADEAGDAEPPEARKPAIVAHRGEHVAYAARHGGVVRRTGDGTWTPAPWEGVVSALAFVDDAGTLVAATYSESDDTTALVRLDAAGRASVVARVGADRGDPESDGRVRAMAHDAAREVVWVAGGFGIAAFAVR